MVISPSLAVNNEEIRSSLTPSVLESYESANDNTMLYLLASLWYPEFWTNYQNTLTALVSGEMDAGEFCQTMEDYAQAVRDDDDITKYQAG